MENGNDKLTIQLNWESICKLSDIDIYKEKLNGKGIYLFVYQKLPYYVGITRDSYYNRLNNHLGLFNDGGRTLKTPNGSNGKITFKINWLPGAEHKEDKKRYFDGFFCGVKVEKFTESADMKVDPWIEGITVYIAQVPLYYNYEAIESMIQDYLTKRYTPMTDSNALLKDPFGQQKYKKLKEYFEVLKLKMNFIHTDELKDIIDKEIP
jgi:hypothetical protein